MNLAFSYFLDRSREYSILTNRKLEITPILEKYHSIFTEIATTKRNTKSLDHCIKSYKKSSENYFKLRNKINSEFINNLLSDLKAS